MYIDYVPLMLINMAVGLILLAMFVYSGMDETVQHRWIPGFAMVGFVALATGLHMIFTWPLPQVYNITHGELSVFYGIIFLGAALALMMRWSLFTVAIYAFLAGLSAVVVGVRVIHLGLTLTPWLSGIGYILTGLAGVFSGPVLFFRVRRNVRGIAVIVLLITAAIWAFIGYGAYWDHLQSMKNWSPTGRVSWSYPANFSRSVPMSDHNSSQV
jgi:putative membrane protein